MGLGAQIVRYLARRPTDTSGAEVGQFGLQRSSLKSVFEVGLTGSRPCPRRERCARRTIGDPATTGRSGGHRVDRRAQWASALSSACRICWCSRLPVVGSRSSGIW